jgi:cytochrome c peroxidase
MQHASTIPKLPVFVAGMILVLSFPRHARAETPVQEPELVALPALVPAPEDNPSTAAKVELGKQLFFDPRLSGDNSMSCATCHLPKLAFADGRRRSEGFGGRELSRNTPGLLNVAFYDNYLWDGRARTLEEQALMPIQAADEMNQELDELEDELNAVPGYVKQFQTVFGTPVTRQGVAHALAAFQRTLVSRDSPFDRYLAGDEQALSLDARRGLELFRGSAGCIRCHNGPLLSDGKFYRLGVGHSDEGRGGVTGKQEDRYKFRTPSLRDVARTAPYMHDGSQRTLTEVVEFYYRTAPTQGPDGLPLDIAPLLDQSFMEIAEIVAFLESLTGKAPEIVPPELP